MAVRVLSSDPRSREPKTWDCWQTHCSSFRVWEWGGGKCGPCRAFALYPLAFTIQL